MSTALEDKLVKCGEKFLAELKEILKERSLQQISIYELEEALWKLVTHTLYVGLTEVLLQEKARLQEQSMRKWAQQKGLGKLVSRPFTLRIRTGDFITIQGLYAQKTAAHYRQSRHLLNAYWGLLEKCTPMYLSLISLFSVACPSFKTAHSLLGLTGIESSPDTNRKLSLALGRRCRQEGSQVQLTTQESLAGQRVIIGVDGGRTRCRGKDTFIETEEGFRSSYQTPWREPCLAVISCLDESGSTLPGQSPVYSVSFDKDRLFEQLCQLLDRLDVRQASAIQFVGDGAHWIWDQIDKCIERLSLPKEKVWCTLDYGHAVSYVHKLVEALPARYHREEYLKKFKNWLWEGQAGKLVGEAKDLFKRKNKTVKQCIGYLEGNLEKMDYQALNDLRLACGSGIVESAIRRVINLRFKNPSTFWKPDNVEVLMNLRAIFLAFRWENMLNRLFKPV